MYIYIYTCVCKRILYEMEKREQERKKNGSNTMSRPLWRRSVLPGRRCCSAISSGFGSSCKQCRGFFDPSSPCTGSYTPARRQVVIICGRRRVFRRHKSVSSSSSARLRLRRRGCYCLLLIFLFFFFISRRTRPTLVVAAGIFRKRAVMCEYECERRSKRRVHCSTSVRSGTSAAILLYK